MKIALYTLLIVSCGASMFAMQHEFVRATVENIAPFEGYKNMVTLKLEELKTAGEMKISEERDIPGKSTIPGIWLRVGDKLVFTKKGEIKPFFEYTLRNLNPGRIEIILDPRENEGVAHERRSAF